MVESSNGLTLTLCSLQP